MIKRTQKAYTLLVDILIVLPFFELYSFLTEHCIILYIITCMCRMNLVLFHYFYGCICFISCYPMYFVGVSSFATLMDVLSLWLFCFICTLLLHCPFSSIAFCCNDATVSSSTLVVSFLQNQERDNYQKFSLTNIFGIEIAEVNVHYN